MDLGVVEDQTDAETYLLGGEFDLLAIGRATAGRVDGYCI
jgi:hypothetical protein